MSKLIYRVSSTNKGLSKNSVNKREVYWVEPSVHFCVIQSFDKPFKEMEKFIVEKKAENLSERVIIFRSGSLMSLQDSLRKKES